MNQLTVDQFLDELPLKVFQEETDGTAFHSLGSGSFEILQPSEPLIQRELRTQLNQWQ